MTNIHHKHIIRRISNVYLFNYNFNYIIFRNYFSIYFSVLNWVYLKSIFFFVHLPIFCIGPVIPQMHWTIFFLMWLPFFPLNFSSFPQCLSHIHKGSWPVILPAAIWQIDVWAVEDRGGVCNTGIIHIWVQSGCQAFSFMPSLLIGSPVHTRSSFFSPKVAEMVFREKKIL